jgi:hypothetical protein
MADEPPASVAWLIRTRPLTAFANDSKAMPSSAGIARGISAAIVPEEAPKHRMSLKRIRVGTRSGLHRYAWYPKQPPGWRRDRHRTCSI